MGFFKWFKKGKKEENLEENINLEEIEQQEEDIQQDVEEDGISEKLEEAKESIREKTEDIREKIGEKIEDIKGDIGEKIEDVKEDIRDKAEDIKEKVSEKIEDAKEDIKEKTEDIKERISEKSEDIKEKVAEKIEDAKEDISEKTEDIKEKVAEKVEDVKERISEKAEDIREKVEDIKEDLIEKAEDIEEKLKKKEDTLNTLEETKQEEEAEEEPKKKGFFAKIKMGLSKTRDSILNGVEQVLSSFTKIDEELFEELEESLIMSDIGVETSIHIMSKVREIVKAERIKDVTEVKNVIVRVISEILEEETEEFSLKSPSVILIIGVNGVGKTTTIGKLANNYKKEGKKVILAAGDTFRAAAIDQLQVWGERSGIDVIKHQEGSDPAAVVFDAIQAGKARGADLLICDTAGRLHNKKNLMEELKKIARIVNRENPDAQIETLLVLDATTGQNALQQAKLFSQVSEITGIVLTKLDGTAKGGVVIAIKNELKIPVRFIGVGEGIDDLRPFDAKEFSKALFE